MSMQQAQGTINIPTTSTPLTIKESDLTVGDCSACEKDKKPDYDNYDQTIKNTAKKLYIKRMQTKK
jgi:hypothetical protein